MPSGPRRSSALSVPPVSRKSPPVMPSCVLCDGVAVPLPGSLSVIVLERCVTAPREAPRGSRSSELKLLATAFAPPVSCAS